MTYKHVSISVGSVFALLAMVLIFVPEIIYWLFQVAQNETADFLAKRAGVLFIGFATLLIVSRNAKASPARTAICVALSVSMFAMAALGIYEYGRGFAGIGIWVAILTEVVIVSAFLYVDRSERP